VNSVLVIALCAIVAGFYAGSESGAYRLNRIRLRREAASGAWAAGLLQRLVSNMERFVCVTLIATNAAYYLATLFCATELRRAFPNGLTAELASVIVLSPILLVVSEVMPKTVFQARPNQLLKWASPALWASDLLFRPLVKLLQAVILLWRRLLGGRRATRQPVVTSQYLHFCLAEGTKEGTVTAQQSIMVRNIMELRNRPVRSVTIPLRQVRMIPLAISAPDARRIIEGHNHARLPVYDGQRDNVVGVLVVLEYLCDDCDGDLAQAMRAPLRIETTLPLDDAFRRLQDAGQTMGIVVDERGRAIGIVTMGDLLQEIFASLDSD